MVITMVYGRDWNNIDLDSPSERDCCIIDSLSFETLLLEIECNLPEINRDTVTKQFMEDLAIRNKEAVEVFKANLDNIVKKAIEYRNIDENYIEEPYFK
jgi:hypothetical protein